MVQMHMRQSNVAVLNVARKLATLAYLILLFWNEYLIPAN